MVLTYIMKVHTDIDTDLGDAGSNGRAYRQYADRGGTDVYNMLQT